MIDTSLETRKMICGWLVCIWFLFIGLGGYDLAPPDEPRFGLVAREMMDNGTWLLPHRNERPYPDKPPLFFWSIAAVSYLTGGEVTALSARLPSALAGLGVLLMLAGWCGRRTAMGLLAPLVLISSFRFFFQAHMAQIDMLLCLLTTGATILGYQAITGGQRRERLMGLLMGLGILAKGPVALIIPMGALALYALFTGTSTWKRFPWRSALWSLLPPLLWLSGLTVEVWLKGEWDYLHNLLFKQTVVRFANPWHHYRPPWYFIQTLMTDFLPWWPFLLLAAPWSKIKRAALSDKQRFCWAVVIWVLFFFSLSKGKRNLYIVPLYPFAAWLIADYLHRAFHQGVPWRFRLVWAFPAALLAVVGVALVGLSTGHIPIKQDLSTFPIYAGVATGIGVLVAAVYALTQLRHPSPQRFPRGIIAAMLIVATFLYLYALPWTNPDRSRRPFMNAVQRIMNEDTHTPNPKLGMVEYRSSFRYHGFMYLDELAPLNLDGKNPKLFGLPNMLEFWQKNPSAYVIITQDHLDAYRERYPQFTPTILTSRKIGSKSRYLLLRCDACLPEVYFTQETGANKGL